MQNKTRNSPCFSICYQINLVSKIKLTNSLSVNINCYVNYMSVKIQQNNPTIMIDRLFGKEISNILDLQHNSSRPRYLSRVHSLANKSVVVEEHSRVAIKKVNKSTANQVELAKIQKNQYPPAKNEDPKGENIALKDVQLVDEYFDTCLKFMISQQSKFHKVRNYLPQQTEVNEKMRGILLDWLIDLHLKFKMFPQTLYLTIMIIDKYLCKKNATKQNLQLIGTAALYIAAKYEQTYQVPAVDQLVYFAAKAFSKEQLIKMEAEIIDVLDFNLVMETSFKFFQPLSRMCKMQQKNFHLAQYVLELSLLQTKFLQYKPSLLASSAIYLINKIRKRPQSWPSSLEQITGYGQKQLKSCAKQLCQLLERADQVQNNKSLKKKFSLPKYNQVTKIKLERKKQ